MTAEMIDVCDDGHVVVDVTTAGSGDPPFVGSLVMITEPRPWAQGVAAYLRREGFDVLTDTTGASACAQHVYGTDIAIIDLDLTAQPGLDVCLAWRARTDAPILAVSSTCEEPTVLGAFSAGVDDVVPADIGQRQLLARLRSLLRRFPPRQGRTVVDPTTVPVTIDEAARCAIVAGTKVSLADQELAVLRMLLGRAGRVVTRAELIDAVSVTTSRVRERSLDFLVRRVREKLEAVDPTRRIMTVRGVGFRFDPDAHGAEASR